MADQHPADELIKSVQGLFNGDNIKQTLRDAWDRIHGTPTPVVTPPKTLDPASAAAIRAKAGKMTK